MPVERLNAQRQPQTSTRMTMRCSGKLAARYAWILFAITGLLSGGWVQASDSKPRVLVHVDVETTGLTAGYHEMIDIGLAVTDEKGLIIDERFIRMMPTFPERLDPGAAAVNGFSVERWQSLGASSEAEGVRELIAFLAPLVKKHQLVFTAFNAWFDQQFVAALLAEHGHDFRSFFHYMVLDLPSMAWSLGSKGLTGDQLARDFGLKAETKDPLQHTGESGVRFNVALYQAMIEAER